jgi:calcineurin-like phosphoesterase family protein
MRIAGVIAVVLMLVLPQAKPADGPWDFAMGLPSERLDASPGQMPTQSTPVTLPHRVAAPNTALWYSRDMDLPAASTIEVSADDGAQVFVDGRRLTNSRRFFAIPPDLTGHRRVTVRVLNNAMQGGLRSVAIVDAAAVRSRERAARPSPPAGFARVDSAAFRARMPAREAACPFTAWADSQGGLATFRRLVDLMAGRRPAFSVGVGDLVPEGADPDAWPAFVDALAPLSSVSPIVPVAGNHDYDGYYNTLRSELYEAWFDRRDATWFAWSCGPVRFAAIDLNREFPIGISEGSTQRHWLEQEMASAAWTRAAWRVLLVHQPPWSKSWAGYDGDEAVRRLVERVGEPHDLDVVISGHSHAYEHLVRGSGDHAVHVFITGGAGGSLEDAAAEALGTSTERIVVRHHFLHATATGTTMTVDAIDVDGARIDRVVLRSRSGVAPAGDRE